MNARTASLLAVTTLLGTLHCAQREGTAPALAERYASLLSATLEEKATAQDVDNFLALCAENVVYEHPRVGAKIVGKEEFRAGMTRFLGASRNPTIHIKSAIEGRGAIVLELEVRAETRRASIWEPLERTQLIVLETEGDRIVRILDHW